MFQEDQPGRKIPQIVRHIGEKRHKWRTLPVNLVGTNAFTVSFLDHFSRQSQRHAGFALVLCFLLYLFSLLILIPILITVVAAMFGLEFDQLQAILQGEVAADSVDTWAFRLIQGGNQLLTWGVVALVMGRILGGIREHLGLGLPQPAETRGMQMAVAASVMMVSLPLVQWLQLDPESFRLPALLGGVEEWMRAQEEVSQQALQAILTTDHPMVLLANLVTFAVIPALCEEMFFRGVIQRQLARLMPAGLAIAVGAVIFSTIHFQFYGFFARAALGMLLGYLFYRSGSLWPSILGHFTFNGVSIVLAYITQVSSEIDPAVLDDSYTFPWPTILGSFLVVVGLCFLFHRLCTPQRISS